MAHPLVLALFPNPTAAAAAARALHARGVERDQISVVSRSHDEEGALRFDIHLQGENQTAFFEI